MDDQTIGHEAANTLESVSGDEPHDERSAEVQRLTNEWLELSLRLELLTDAKKEFLAGWRKDEATAKKRIKEIRSELEALRSGASLPESDESDEASEPKQLELPQTGGQS